MPQFMDYVLDGRIFTQKMLHEKCIYRVKREKRKAKNEHYKANHEN